MNDQDIRPVSNERSTGRAVMGALLVAAGAALLIDRLGAMPATWRVSVWPLLVIGYGCARLFQPRAQGREGLFFVLAGAWWLAGVSGWISLQRTWPLLFVALGVSVMFQAATPGDPTDLGSGRLRRRGGAAPWLLVAILLGAAASAGLDRHTFEPTAQGEGVLHVYSVLGGSNSHMRSTTLTGGQIVAIMGGSAIDLRDVTIAPGSTVTLDVFTLMGGGAIRVPDQWIVDVEAVPILGGIKDQRIPHDVALDSAGGADPAQAVGPAPRLILRGTVIMGGLTIKS